MNEVVVDKATEEGGNMDEDENAEEEDEGKGDDNNCADDDVVVDDDEDGWLMCEDGEEDTRGAKPDEDLVEVVENCDKDECEIPSQDSSAAAVLLYSTCCIPGISIFSFADNDV